MLSGATLNGGQGIDTVNTLISASPDLDYSVDLIAGSVGVVGVSAWSDLPNEPPSGAIDTLISIENVITGGGDDLIIGNAESNWLTANGGTDRVEGRGGLDNIVGGSGEGNDYYDGGEDADTIWYTSTSEGVYVNLSMPGNHAHSMGEVDEIGIDQIYNIENVVGGAGADWIIGDEGDNVIEGGDGADLLQGSGGNDTVSFAHEQLAMTIEINPSWTTDAVRSDGVVDEIREFENVIGGAGDDSITGDAGANRLTGGDGNDTLDGKAGIDQLFGGAGNDIYYVDNVSDLVAEDEASGGTDLVYSSVTLTLGNYLENLTLTGTAAIDGTGNTLANKLTGNAAANVLNGGTGADNLFGGAGNDIYYVDNAYDVTTETSSTGGIDLVYSSVTRTLGNYFENLTLTGTAAIDGTGNTLANKLTGNAAANKLSGGTGNDTLSAGSGNDVLTGGAGRDVMTGGSGNDLFDFNAVSEIGNSLSVCDVIADFQHGYDDIDLSTIDASTKLSGNNAFVWRGTASAFGTSTAGELRYRQFNNAGTANDYTVVYGDTDGDTAAEFQIKLTGLVTLSASDFKL